MLDIQVFNGILMNMSSPSNDVRKEAEEQYDRLSISGKVSMLFQLFGEKQAIDEVRALCLVLLRRICANDWDKMAAELGPDLSALTTQILKCALDETSDVLSKKLTDVIAEVAKNTIDDETGKQKWRDVLQFLESCITIGSARLNLTAVRLIEAVPNIFGSDQDQYINGIKHLFGVALIHADESVRVAATRALVSFLSMNDEDDNLIKAFQGFVPAMLNICQQAIGFEDVDNTPFVAISDLISVVPKVVNPHIGQLCEMSISIIANTEADESYRHSVMEILTTICEESANTVKKKYANYIPRILQSAVLLMTELDEDVSDWLAVDDVDDCDVEEDTVAVGESSLDRIACSLGGKVILQPFQDIAQHLLADEDWRKRHAALMGLSTIGEGCRRAMEPVIDNVINIVVPFLKDVHPRVRYAACNAMGQMSTDFGPTFQKRGHERVVAGLLTAIEDTSCPRVSAHAGAALVNFSEDCPQQIIASYMAVIMSKLEGVLESTFKVLQDSGKKIILEQIITTIASVADAAKDVFAQYYDRLVPPLKYILNHLDSSKYKILRGKTIECLSLIGLAVGKEKFHADSLEIMNVLSTSMRDLETDDPQCTYMIGAWTRICRVLGPDFAPFLPVVMEPLIRTASYAPEVAFVDDDNVTDDAGWEYHSLGVNRNVGIRTTGLEEKATACEMLVCYARDLKEAFLPYVDKVAELVIAHLKFAYHDGVRSSAAETLPLLLECVKNQGVDAMRRLWVAFLPSLISASENEEDTEVLSEILSSVASCLTVVGREGLIANEVLDVGKLLQDQFNNYEARRSEREATEADEDEDPDEAKELLDDELLEEAGIMARISDIIHSGLQALGEDFYGVVEPLLSDVVKLINVRRHYTDRQWGICIVDDVLEFAPCKLADHQDQFIPLMLQSLADEFPEVRQAAAYGLGIMAYGGAAYVNAMTSALQPLAMMINRPEVRETEEGAIATENAIAAVAKIMKHGGLGGDSSEIIKLFLSWLPTHEDDEESVHIYGYLCDLIQSNNPSAIGANNENLPLILMIIVSAFELNAFNETKESNAVQKRLITIVKMMQGSGMFDDIVQRASLTEEKTATLHSLLSREA